MRKVVINKCYGGFSLSPIATLWLWERGYRDDEFATPVEEYWDQNPTGYQASDEYQSRLGFKAQLNEWRAYLRGEDTSRIFLTAFSDDEKYVLHAREIRRDHPLLIQCIEELGPFADGELASLKVVDIPDKVKWHISEYDGLEHVAQDHETWG